MTSGGCGPNTRHAPDGMGAMNVGAAAVESSGMSRQDVATAFAFEGGFGSWQSDQVTAGFRMRPVGDTARTS